MKQTQQAIMYQPRKNNQQQHKIIKSKWSITIKGFFGIRWIISKYWNNSGQMECFWSSGRCRESWQEFVKWVTIRIIEPDLNLSQPIKIPQDTKNSRYQKLVSSVVEKSDNEKLHVKSVLLSLQLQWTRCCNYIKLDLSWKISLPMPQPLLFSIFLCLGTTYDTLPSPSNLYR